MKLYNTLSREKEEFKPLKPGKASLYTCGLTVYSQPHIGNWVAYIYWDLLHRTLIEEGYDVKRVQNITDVGHLVSDDDDGEDKLELSAKAEKTTAWEIAKKYTDIASKEAKELNLLEPTILVAATDRIEEQMQLVDTLTKKGLTYELEDGIYFDSSQFGAYGDLAKIDKDGLQEGIRVANSGKKNATDFAVWKFSPKGAKRDMEWEYPKGSGKMGFPGWHLECSAIALTELGEQIDIHTGGIDHIPVHHSNEIAQSESATGKKFANYWIHNNHIKIDGTKLSKSLKNSFTLQDVKDKGFDIEAFKLLVLSSHYQTEGNFSWEILEAAQNRLNTWKEILKRQSHPQSSQPADEEGYEGMLKVAKNHLTNNLDTPKTLAQLDIYIGALGTDSLGADTTVQKKNFLKFISANFGIGKDWSTSSDVNESFEYNGEKLSFTDLLDLRAKARSEKDWAIADELRKLAEEKGITIKDTAKSQLYSN